MPCLAAFFHPDDLGHAFEVYNQGIKSGEDFTAEHRIRGADGSLRWFRTAGSACRDADGKIIAFACNITDIDELAKARRRRPSLCSTIEPVLTSRPPSRRLGSTRSSSRSAPRLFWQGPVRRHASFLVRMTVR